MRRVSRWLCRRHRGGPHGPGQACAASSQTARATAKERGSAGCSACRGGRRLGVVRGRQQPACTCNNIPFADHGALLDPSTEDMTGRVLELMGAFGTTARLRAGRAGHRLDPPGPAPRRAVVRALGRQLHLRHVVGAAGLAGPSARIRARNTSSGPSSWLEAPAERRRGLGRGAATATGGPRWRVWARRCRARRRGRSWACSRPGIRAVPTVERGVDYLLRTQGPTGTWEDSLWNGTGFPRVFFLKYHYYAKYFPCGLWACIDVPVHERTPLALAAAPLRDPRARVHRRSRHARPLRQPSWAKRSLILFTPPLKVRRLPRPPARSWASARS